MLASIGVVAIIVGVVALLCAVAVAAVNPPNDSLPELFWGLLSLSLMILTAVGMSGIILGFPGT